jgi:quinol monooxygenase YgiN
MYGLIAKMMAIPGRRDDVIALILDGASNMPGCLSYVVAKDASDVDAIWISEVWHDKASHHASLQLPSVRDAISRAKPLIAGFGQQIHTEPVGGHGLG